MPRKSTVPKYRRHANGQAFVQIKGRRFYLGKFGSPDSHDRYAKLIADLPKAVERLPALRTSRFPTRFSINELIVAYLKYAQGYYRKPNGEQSSEVENLKYAFRPLAERFGASDAIEFDTLCLKEVRQAFVDANLRLRLSTLKEVLHVRESPIENSPIPNGNPQSATRAPRHSRIEERRAIEPASSARRKFSVARPRIESRPFRLATYGSSEKFCNTTTEVDAAHETRALRHTLESSSC